MDNQLRLLAETYQQQLLTLTQTGQDRAILLFRQFLTNPSDTAKREFLEAIVPLNQAVRAQAVELSIAYVEQVEFLQTGDPIDYDIDVEAIIEDIRNGVDSETTMERSVSEVRYQLSEGATLDEALEKGEQRTEQMMDTDVMLAGRAGTSAAMKASGKFAYYWRYPDPGACDFCVLVSTRKYKVRNLMPVHARCHCTQIPVIGNDPNAPVPEPKELEADDIAIRQHGEYGPVVVNASHHFKDE